MTIIDSNSDSPLKYTDPTYQTLLFIRANIYDLSGSSPVLENTVNLALIDNGTYQGKYQFTKNKPYLIQKLVYTDGTYTTVDQNYAQDNDDVQCIDLQGGGTIPVQMATDMTLETTETNMSLDVPELSMDIDIEPELEIGGS